MKRIACAAALIASVSCATALMGQQIPPDVTGSLEELRVRQGVCARAVANGDTVKAIAIRTCLQTGSPGTLADDKRTPVASIRIVGHTFDDANPGSWQLTVTDERGREVHKGLLKERVPDVGLCDSTGCLKNGYSAVFLDEPWLPGKYTFRYVCAFDTTAVAVATVTLLAPGAAVPAAATGR